MNITEIAHICIAVLNLLTALVAWLAGRRRGRADAWSEQDRRERPRER